MTTTQCKVFEKASDFIPIVWAAFGEHPQESNVIFAHAEENRKLEEKGICSDARNLWIAIGACDAQGELESVDFVLSCTEDYLGKKPVFIFTTHSPSVDPSDIENTVAKLVDTLDSEVDKDRVFSVFAPTVVAELFAELWTRKTGVELEPEPKYYVAKISYCTAETLKQPRAPDQAHQMRKAVDTDKNQVAVLVYEFAEHSMPFVLSREKARMEAEMLIRKGQLWVCEVQKGDGWEIACIVAVTRSTESVAAITKVYTHDSWRRRRYAEALTRFVCEELLETEPKKSAVVLYVGNENSARLVYSRVGFVGLEDNSDPEEGVHEWSELGFNRSKVNLGHW